MLPEQLHLLTGANLAKIGEAGLVVQDIVNTSKVQEGQKVLAQFSKKTIDEAALLISKQKELHIFCNKLHPKPWLNQLAKQMGGNENVIRAALENANGKIITNAYGIFNTEVTVDGVKFIIRGYMNNDIPIINSMFIAQ